MPRFYFHVRRDGELLLDDEGTDLPDLAAAKREARATARDFAVDAIRSRNRVNDDIIEVMDENGEQLFGLPVREVVC